MQESVKNVRKDSALGDLIDRGRLKLISGDGRKGYEQHAPYDAIHVGAAAPDIPQPVSSYSSHI